ncbi:hypothetical protein COEREDRAFT_95181 [Coemansia reversa NRRL 1564]|uniref:Nuclear rim protein 1 n=1 Tax=Coemansia reversa (strain ATCC 12441 / NRRL 1564) TaxID=763665 RepID=A0A2G5BKZ3_COERN|nr:hypothetical protein COEREDRAFT_95181 [Coemansia reversa NRRL 1564]|eukprot:PIA19673.1 hypothetical protein COEREDRAFT_95181 [Coemansia reversa NRRL 1564]
MVIIRRQRGTFWEAIREAPRDWLLHLAEDYQLVNWNRISETTSWPCALALNGVFVLVSLARHINVHRDNLDAIVDVGRRHRTGRGTSSHGWVDTYDTGIIYDENKSSSWDNMLLLLQILLYIISVVNAWILFSNRRTYQLRMRDADATTFTSSCRRVSLGTHRPGWTHSLLGRCLWLIWKLIARVDDQTRGEIWELALWTPSTFSRNLFCWYSPMQLLLLSFMDSTNWYYILPLAVAVAAQCTFVVFAYSTLVKDKQILYGEVQNEYNQMFVYPNIFAPKSDVATSTLDDWIIDRKANALSASSNISTSHMRPEHVMRDNNTRRRTTAFVAEEDDSGKYLSQEKYRRAPHYRGQSKDSPPVPAPYVRTNSSERYAVPRHASARVNQPYAEPSGTHRVRDRSNRRRRYTELVENTRHAK